MSTILFTSQRPLERAENIHAVYDAYTGPKKFVRLDWYRRSDEINSGKYSLMVSDEIPLGSPGKVIMINHGVTGNKLYGLDQPRPYANKRECDLITYAITASPDLVALTARQLAIPESRVLPLGLPRSDAYIGKTKGQGGTGIKTKRVYFYAPTYRSQSERPSIDIDWLLIDNLLTDDEILIVKPHMLTQGILRDNYKHIIEVSNKDPSTPYLIDCDCLITDYSSIMIDGLIARRPVVLFDKDLRYLTARGMYYKYPDKYSSYYCAKEYDLVKTLRRAVWTDSDEERRRFFAVNCDGNSTKRVVDLIKEVDNEDRYSGTDF